MKQALDSLVYDETSVPKGEAPDYDKVVKVRIVFHGQMVIDLVDFIMPDDELDGFYWLARSPHDRFAFHVSTVRSVDVENRVIEIRIGSTPWTFEYECALARNGKAHE